MAATGPLGISAPWRDPAGRFSWLKLVALLLVILPGALLVLQWAQHQLGGRPITEMIHGMGDWTVRFFLMSLAVTPARPILAWPRVLILRRLLGVTCACYAFCHFLLYNMDEKWQLLTVFSEIALRFYLTIGFFALLGLLTLAITSTDEWQKTLGPRWKLLHKAVFPIGFLALWHYALQSKADVTSAIFCFGIFAWLFLWRQMSRRMHMKLWPLPLLAVLAALITAGVEAAWYGLATGAPAMRVLMANLDVSYGFRPAVNILLLGALVWAMAAFRRIKWHNPFVRRAPVRVG